MFQKATLCALAYLSLAWTSPATAQSVLLYPTKTNTLIQVPSTSDQQLSNGQGDIFVGLTNGNGLRRGLVAFDIADNIPAGATITSVTFTADDVKGMNGDQTISLAQMLGDWGQGGSYSNGGRGVQAANNDVTWYYTFYNAADPSLSPTWTTPGGDFSSAISASTLVLAGSTNQTFSWSSTVSSNSGMLTDVQQWLDSPATNFGWIMLGNESLPQTAQRFGGQTAANDPTSGETPPTLTVQYLAPWIWTGSADTAWTTSGNWTTSGSGSGIPPGGAAIVLGGSSTTGGTVDLLSAAPTVSHITFNANTPVTITSTAAGGGRLTLDNGGSPAAVAVSGSQSIDATVAVTLNNDGWITTLSGSDTLSVAGDISSGTAGGGIIKDGLGTLILSGSNTYTGGTTVNDGILKIAAAAALPPGSSLTVGAGATLLFSDSDTANPAAQSGFTTVPVPEPGTFGLLFAAIAILLAAIFRHLVPHPLKS